MPMSEPTSAPLFAVREIQPHPDYVDDALPQLDAVFRFAMRLSGGLRAEAAALVEETFVEAYRAWPARDTASGRGWLLGICRARLRAADGAGSAGADSAAEIGALASIAAFEPVAMADPARAFFDVFDDDELLHAIDSLPLAYREVLVLRDLEGADAAETAVVVGLPVEMARRRLYRARRRLQQSLHELALELGYARRPGADPDPGVPLACDQTRARLWAYLDDELTEAHAVEIAAHLGRCAHCAARFAPQRDFRARMQRLAAPSVPAGLERRVFEAVLVEEAKTDAAALAAAVPKPAKPATRPWWQRVLGWG
jgi:RNA polymerase sigma-70 factor, ECF subfamily